MPCCEVCGTAVNSTKALIKSREGHNLCTKCAVRLHFCEVCGSVAIPPKDANTQLHYEEECFK